MGFVWKPISAKTRYILQWMKCVSREKTCMDFILTICGGHQKKQKQAGSKMEILGLPFTKMTAFVYPVSSANPMNCNFFL